MRRTLGPGSTLPPLACSLVRGVAARCGEPFSSRPRRPARRGGLKCAAGGGERDDSARRFFAFARVFLFLWLFLSPGRGCSLEREGTTTWERHELRPYTLQGRGLGLAPSAPGGIPEEGEGYEVSSVLGCFPCPVFFSSLPWLKLFKGLKSIIRALCTLEKRVQP